MENNVLWHGICFFIGCFVGGTWAGRVYKHSFKRFTDEVHSQYLELLKKHGIYKG